MKPGLKTAAKVVVSAGLLAFLLHGVDSTAMLRAVTGADLVEIAAAALALLALTPVLALRWRAITSALGMRFAYGSALAVVLAGMFFNQFLPSAVGGDAYRAWALRRSGVPLNRALHSLLLDRGTGLLATLLMTVAGLPVLYAVIPDGIAKTSFNAVLAASIVAGVAAFPLASWASALPLTGRFGRLHPVRLVREAAADFGTLARDPKALSSALGCSIVMNVVVSLAFWLIADSVGQRLPVLDCVFLVPLVMLMSMLPISVGGWGVREGSMVVALGFLGVPAVASLAASVIYGMAIIAIGLPGGIVWLLAKHKAPAPPAPGERG